MKVARFERVTVTLPDDLLREIDRREKNRSKFVADAVRRELEHRRRVDLRRSLDNPDPESIELAEQGIEEWSRLMPDENVESLIDPKAVRPIRWRPGQGWVAEHP
ncbi:MAG: ribbon-helix-helix domain-containing protein [Candidatus Solibacter sp.]